MPTPPRKPLSQSSLIAWQVFFVLCGLTIGAFLLAAFMPRTPGSDTPYIIQEPMTTTLMSTSAAKPMLVSAPGQRTDAPQPEEEMEEEEENEVTPAEEVLDEVDPPEVLAVAPEENVGTQGRPEDHLASAEQAPEAAVDSCDHYHPSELTPEMIVKVKDGPAKTSFAVEIDGLRSDWTVMTVMRMPGETFTVDLVEADAAAKIAFSSEDGFISYSSDTRWTWRSPTVPGIYCVKLENTAADETMCIHVAVLHPYDEGDSINGYKIGEYKSEPFRNNPRYTAPEGFIEVTEENQHTWLSPHFQLRQFVCKQQGSFPKYLLAETRLLIKLELLIESLEKEGIRTNGLYLLSAFRTPYYNQAIGNKTFYSRHLYGDAADLFVDSNGDGMLDDLNGDGEITVEDAKILQKAVRGITDKPLYKELVGGLGLYDKVNYRNPFIHVDTRGYRADWMQ